MNDANRSANNQDSPPPPPPLPPAFPASVPIDEQQMDDANDAHLPRFEADTQRAGSTFDEGRGRMFPCENCGADLQFSIGVQSLACPYCGHVREITLPSDAEVIEQDFHQMLEKLQQWREAGKRGRDTAESDATVADAEVRELHCSSCGGSIVFTGTLTSTHCPYCNSPVQLETAHQYDDTRISVDGVLPFQIDRNRAQSNLKAWVDSRWFAPGSFRKQGASGKFNGIYLSYFTFDTMTSNAYSGQRGEYYYVTVGSGKNKRRERRTRWYPAAGTFQRFFDDVLVLANTGLRRDFMLALEPWPMQKVVPFNQQMLAGFLAKTYDIDLDQCFDDAKSRIDAAIHTEVRQRIGGDTQRVHSIRSRYEAITFKHVLLPTWLMAYQFNNKSYQVFINAATGEVQGERPYSAWKIAFAVLCGLITAGLLFALTRN